MKTAQNMTALALAGTLLVLSTFPIPATGRGSVGAGWGAAVSRCVAQARSQYPGKYWDWGQARTFAYRACIFDAGFPP
jgi:hypothetical protein